MNPNEKAPLQDFLRRVLTGILLIMAFPYVMQWVFPIIAKNLERSVNLDTVVSPSLVRSERPKNTEGKIAYSEWALLGFPDLNKPPYDGQVRLDCSAFLPRERIPANSDSTKRSPAIGLSHEEWTLKDFPDLKQFVNEVQYRMIMDVRVPMVAREYMLAEAWRRKVGLPSLAEETQRRGAELMDCRTCEDVLALDRLRAPSTEKNGGWRP